MKRLILALCLAGVAHAAGIAHDGGTGAADFGHFAAAGSYASTSFTVNGPNACVFLYATTQTSSSAITSASWNGNAMTHVGAVTNSTTITTDVYVLFAAPPGSGTFTGNANGASSFHLLAAAYSGVSSSVGLDQSANTGATFTSNTTNQGNALLTSNFTTSKSGDWLVLFGNSVGGYAQLTNLTATVNAASDVGSINDSNASVGTAGAYSVQTNVTGQGALYANGILLTAISPAPTGGGGSLLLTGAGK